jgi:hypothetical protein
MGDLERLMEYEVWVDNQAKISRHLRAQSSKKFRQCLHRHFRQEVERSSKQLTVENSAVARQLNNVEKNRWRNILPVWPLAFHYSILNGIACMALSS